MTATCPNCSKALKVKDEWAGRTIKCPACTTTFKATAQSPVHPSRPAPAAAKAKADKARGGFAINWTTVAVYCCLALIPIGIALILVGPIRVKRHWDANASKVEDDVRDVLDYALKCQASRSGLWNPNKSRPAPSVADLRFLPEIVAMRIPSRVTFDGTTSNGNFEGTYAFADGEIDLTLNIEGFTLPGGVHIGSGGISIPGGPRNAPAPAGVPKFASGGAKATIHITGRAGPGGPQAELDGKRAEIYYPPPTDDDGNLIPADPPAK